MAPHIIVVWIVCKLAIVFLAWFRRFCLFFTFCQQAQHQGDVIQEVMSSDATFTSSEFTFPRSFRQSLAVGSRSDFVFALGSAPVSKTLASWVIELRTPLYNSYTFSSVAQYTMQHRDVQRGYSKQGNPIQPPLFQQYNTILTIPKIWRTG